MLDGAEEARGVRFLRNSMAMRACTAGAAVLLSSSAVEAAAQNLYEWMAVAPIVVLGRVVVDDERYVEMEVTKALVGEVPRDRPLSIDQRNANRDREARQDRLQMEKGRTYLILLEPEVGRRAERVVHYRIVRGALGAREVPPEGGAAFMEAAERMAQVHALKDDRREWLAFGQLLEDTNPLLVKTALDMLLKFRRCVPEQIPLLRPLLDHPQPDLRAAAARLIAQVAELPGASEALEESGLTADVIGRARRDPSVDVRVAATACLAALGGTNAEVVLKEIAREDPEQEVRYAAERALYEKSQDGGARPRRN